MQYDKFDFSGAEIKNPSKPHYGYGLIDKIEDDIISIYYEEKGNVDYQFPKCFIEGYIELVDPVLEDIVLDILIEEEKQHNLQVQQQKLEIQKQKELEKQLRHGREEPKIKMLRYGDCFTSHHQILNECFSQNYKRAVRGGYIIDKFIMAWFPMESKYEFGEYLPVCEEGWINKFEDNMIYEYNKSRNFKETEMSNLERCVFAKFLNKNNNYKPEYCFIGVYGPLNSKETPRYSYSRKYIKVANDFNLLSMEPEYFKE